MWLLWSAFAQAAIVDRVIAIVGEDPVLASEVALEIELAAVDRAPIPLWTCERPPEQIAIDAALIRGLADEVALYQPAQEAVVARTLAIRDAFGSRWEAFLVEHGLDLPALQVIVRRRMIVERFLLRALATDPADGDAWLAAYDEILGGLRDRVRVRVIPLHGRTL